MARQRDRLVGQFVNRVKGSTRTGQRFRVVTRGGQRGHLYAGGRFVPDKAGPSPRAGIRPSTGGTPAPRPSTPSPPRPRAGRQQPAPTPPRPATPTAGGFTTDPAARERLRAAATGQGRFLNVAEQSPSYGQRFGIVQRRGKRYHKYRPGRLIADVQRGAGTARYRRRKPKPAPATTTPAV